METTTEAKPHPLANVPKAVDALVRTGNGLLNTGSVTADELTISRNTWFKACANTLSSGLLTRAQKSTLKGLRDRLRRHKVGAKK